MLTGEQGSRRDYCNLHPGHGSRKGSAHCDLGFAKANVTTDQAVHRLARCHVGEHFLDRLLLIVGFLIREAIHEAGHFAGLDASGCRRLQCPRRSGSEQLVRDCPDAFLELGFATLPGFPAKPVEHNAFTAFAIATEHINIFHGNVKFVTTGIFQMHTIMRAFANRNGDNAFV